MMIAPVIFCTIVLGIGSVRKAAKVGKVGGLALGYFLVMSTVALAIGLVVGNLIHPGAGLHLTDGPRQAGPGRRPATAPASTADFLLGIIPTTLFSALTEGEVLQTLLVALLVGFALQAHGPARASRSCAASSTSSGSSSGSSPMIMWAGPDRRVRRDGRRRRRDRRGRAQEPRAC